jgi:hypothetical protein
MGLIMDDYGDIQLVGAIPSSLPRHDLLLLTGLPQKTSSQQAAQRNRSNSLPISPYPVPIGTAIAAHFIIDKESVQKTYDDGWIPCFNGMMYRKWVKGHVVGYRDFAGNEAKVNIPTLLCSVMLICDCLSLEPTTACRTCSSHQFLRRDPAEALS